MFLSGAREAGLIGFTLLLVTVVSIHSPRFLALDNFGEIALDVAILTIVAIGQMMVAITGGIISRWARARSFRNAWADVRTADLNPARAVVWSGYRAWIGSLNGLLVAKGKVPPIITTLGTMSIYRGMTFIVSGGRWVNAHEMPARFISLARGSVFGIPISFHRDSRLCGAVILPHLHETRARGIRSRRQQ